MNKKEREKFKDELISYISENDTEKDYLIEQINKVHESGNSLAFFSRILRVFVHNEFSETEAKIHWKMIFEQYNYLLMALKRNVGIQMAILDYFLNISKILANPILVEIHIFKQTEKLAMIDALTGLFNRRFFDLSIQKEFKRARRYKTQLSMILIDLDDFKHINDTKGHLFGDMVLRNLAGLLTKSSREEDIICRYGGEEFIIILPNISAPGALKYIERKRELIKADTFFSEDNITFSAGISAFPSEFNMTGFEEMIKYADIALYQAKYAGKDRAIIYKDDNRRERRFRLSWNVLYKVISSETAVDEYQKVITQDISLGGLKFESTKKMDLGTGIVLFVNVISDVEANGINLLGKIVWVREIKKNTYGYGVEFYDLTDEQIEQLEISLPTSVFLSDLEV